MRRFPIDWHIIVPILLLSVISLSVLFSFDKSIFRAQVINLSIGLTAFFVFSQIKYQAFFSVYKPLYFFSLILLLVVMVVGLESRGAVRWIEIFGVRAQLSEIIKPILALSISGYISFNTDFSLKRFFFLLLFTLPVFLLVALQPDLGNALIFAFVLIGVMIFTGFPYWYFFIIILPGVLVSPMLWGLMHEYQRQRILTFIHPSSDPLGATYNVMQAIIAVGSGFIFGRGIEGSTQSGLSFLPEKHTDFIFATIAENFGFVGSMIVISSFAYILFRLIRIVQNTHDVFGRIYVVCAFLFFSTHIVVNIGMNIGIVPVVGVTLPFVSYGGSSVLASSILLGIVSSVSSGIKREVLEIR